MDEDVDMKVDMDEVSFKIINYFQTDNRWKWKTKIIWFLW